METQTHKVINFFELCRLCLEKHGMSDIFEIPDLVGDITLCTGVMVSSTDNLPPKICMRCLEVVVKARRLRDQASANDKHLKSLFGNDETEKQCTKSNTQNNEYENISNSSYDSDSPKLQIDEDAGVEKSKSNKRSFSEVTDNNRTGQVLSIRKDLFDSTTFKTSPTKDIKPLENITIVQCQRIKKEKGETENYECENCEKTFNVWKKYYLHQRSHNRKIVCTLDACGKKFATKGDLEKHIRTHTGERPFKCEICGKSFAQRGSLKGHRETIHASLL